MPRKLRRASTWIAMFLGVAMLTTGCLGTAGGYIPDAKLAGQLATVKRLDGASIAVGSKSFSEGILLSKMAILMLRGAGAKVKDLTNIPGSAASRQAMLDNQFQFTWEYTGTGWITYLGNDTPIPDERKQYEAVRDADLAQHQLVWLPPAPLNNTYSFAITKATAQKYGATKLSDLARVPVAERTLCVESELVNRPDGLKGMLDTYGIPLGAPQGVPRGNLRTFQAGAIYDATAKGECNFGEVYTTDGRIVALNLEVLQDDKNFFPKYNASPVLTEAVYKQYPQIADLFAPVVAKLTNDVMLKLNAQIDVDGIEPVDVADAWLKEQGFLAR